LDNSVSELPERVTRRNILLSALNSSCVEASMTFTEASEVLTLYVRMLGGSSFLVGLLPSLRYFGWLAPQFVAAGRMQSLRHFVPTIQLLEIIRCSFYLIIALMTLLLGVSNPGLVLGVFFVLYLITRIAAGSSAVARAELVARMVPPRRRASVISVRAFAGGAAGFLAGLVVRVVLDPRVGSFPGNYATLLGMSGIGFGLAIVSLIGVVEPHSTIPARGVDWRAQLRRAPALLRADRQYLRYIGVRIALTGLELASPFYILYATEVLGAPAHMAGIYIAVRTFSRVLSNMYWGEQCRRRSSVWVLRLACGLGLLAPLSVLMLVVFASRAWADGAPGYAVTLFGGVFFLQGLAASALGISEMAYLYDVAPEAERPTYYGLTNTVLGPLYFLPALGGALLDTVGYAAIFGATTVMILIAVILASRLDVHQRLTGPVPSSIGEAAE
jgi:MFS family permease